MDKALLIFRFALISGIVFHGLFVSAQTPVEISNINAKTKTKRYDTSYVGLLLKIASYQINKPGERKEDLDSAGYFINKAARANNKLKDEKYAGVIDLKNYYLSEKQGKFEEAKRYAGDAIAVFLTVGGNYSLLAESFMAFSKYCSFDAYQTKRNAILKAVAYYYKDGNFQGWGTAKLCERFYWEVENRFLDDRKTEQLSYAKFKPGIIDIQQMEILLQLAKYQIKKPLELKSDLDSAAAIINQVQKNNLKLRDDRLEGIIALNNAYLNEERQNISVALANNEKAIKFLTRTGKNYSLLGDAYVQLAILFIKSNKSAEWEKTIRKAIDYYRLSGDKEKEADAIMELGTDNFGKGKSEVAEKQYNLAVLLYKSSNEKKLPSVYQQLANIALSTGDLQKIISLLLEGEKYIDSSTPALQQLAFDQKLTGNYYYLGLMGPALIWAKKGAELSKTLGDFAFFSNCLRCEYLCLTRSNKPAEALAIIKKSIDEFPPQDPGQQRTVDEGLGDCYLMLHQNEKAEQCYIRVEKSLKNISSEYSSKNLFYYHDYAVEAHALARFYFNLKKFSKAEKFIRLADTLIYKQPNPEANVVRLKERLYFRIDSALGDYRGAFYHYLLFTKINDSVFNSRKTKELSELNVKYETEKKLRDIKLLKIQGRGQQLELQKISLQRNLTIGAIIMLLIITVLAFKGFRLKQRNHLQLQIKQNKINQQNILLEHLVREKDVLLMEKEGLLEDKEILMREIHHRVKNNLHMISSLLESQSAYLENEALLAIQKSQHRVQAISLIHQKLYMDDKITNVYMSTYLREIVDYLQDSFITDEHVVFNLDLDPIQLDVTQAVPVGLIVNESVTNAIKYAFPKGRKGLIEISMKQCATNKVHLAITDNGIGLPNEFDHHGIHNNSLGMNLIQGLSKSVQGKLMVSSGPGTKIELTFFNNH